MRLKQNLQDSKIMKLKFLLFLISQIAISQTEDVKKILVDGEKAFVENNFQLAKEIYSEGLKLDPKNKDFWYNLASSEFKLGNNENACEDFYQAYLLNDGDALVAIKENCPNFRNGSIMSLKDVEEKPKFIYKDKEYLLFENEQISPKYINFLRGELKRSRIIYEKAIGRNVYVHFSITNADNLNVKIANVTGNQKDAEIIKQELISIFNKSFTYISAKNKGSNVDLWEKWSLPISF
jgi:tetratricopeptide (TPR) repeat protein